MLQLQQFCDIIKDRREEWKMKLQYIVSVPATSTAEITLPFGVSQVKLRGSVPMPITGIGQISNAGINQCTSIRIPIIDGKSPNTFSAYNSEANAANFYLFVEELGGIPDPDYFTGGATSE